MIDSPGASLRSAQCGSPKRSPQWATFAVSVGDFAPFIVTARSRSAARYEAYLRYSDPWPCAFVEFLRITRVQSCGIPADDGYGYVRSAYGVDVRPGDRITLTGEGARLEGRGATVIYPGRSTSMVHIVIDGEDHSCIVHPQSVKTGAALLGVAARVDRAGSRAEPLILPTSKANRP